MFKELAPLLQQRSVVIMVNPLEGDVLRVIVMPKRLNDNENAALSTPVSVSGTPVELDEQLPSTLTQFVGAHLELKNTLEIAKEEMAQAGKAARQIPKAKASQKPGSADAGATRTNLAKAENAAAEPAEPKNAPVPTTANLFDFGSTPAPAPAPAAPEKPLPTTASVGPADDELEDDAEIMAEIAESDRASEEIDPAA